MSKKRRYRATDVKRVNVAKVAEQVRGKRIVFSVDMSKGKPYGAVMTPDREISPKWKWSQPRDTRLVVEVLEGLPASSLEVAMEPSGTYGDPLRALLIEKGIPLRLALRWCHAFFPISSARTAVGSRRHELMAVTSGERFWSRSAGLSATTISLEKMFCDLFWAHFDSSGDDYLPAGDGTRADFS